MKSNYKRLGNYIEETGNKNSDGKLKLLQGISNNKYFQKAKTNTNGIDLTTYRVVKTNEFAFNRATTRNGEKISIALRKGKDCVVSPSYRIFKSKNENILNSEFLDMWFKRPEFDRYARFKSHGSAHEFFDYDAMCEVEIPLPPIEKQQEIVNDYNTVQERIAINEQLNTALEDTAQALYKHWFVDFEFPTNVSSSAVENGLGGEKYLPTLGYKSSGGKMVYNEELDKEIPEGWEVRTMESCLEDIISHRGKSKLQMDIGVRDLIHKNPIVSAKHIKGNRIVKNNEIGYVDDTTLQDWMVNPLKENDVLLTSEAPMGEVKIILIEKNFLLSQRLFALRARKNYHSGIFLFFWLQQDSVKREMSGRASGTTVMGIKLSELKKVNVLVPDFNIIQDFNNIVKNYLISVELSCKENDIYQETSCILLSKMATAMDDKGIKRPA